MNDVRPSPIKPPKSPPPPQKITGFLNRFTYSQKFIIISILFALSLIASGYYMIRDQNLIISTTQLERKGLIYERAVQKLMQNLPEHQWKAYRYLSGDTKFKSDLDNLATAINAGFKYLKEVDQELQIPLKTTAKDFARNNLPDLTLSHLEEQWNEINRNLNTLKPDASNELHDALISNLRALMLYIGETSNLILDPTVQVNYFIQTILWDLPKAQTLVPRMINLIQNVLDKNKVTRQDEDQLLIINANLQNNIKDLKRDSKKAELNKSLEELSESSSEVKYRTDNLKTPLTTFLNTMNEWSSFVEDVVKNIGQDNANLKTFNYIALATANLEANFALWDAIANEIDDILTARIAKLERQQVVSIVVSFFTALVGLAFGLIMMRQISHPLTNLVNAAKSLSAGNLSTRVTVAPDNEIGQVGIAFNQMAEAFQEVISNLQKTSLQLSTSSTEIAAVAKQQETSIVEQEASTKQIANSAQKISKTAKEFAKTMNKVSDTAEQTSSIASTSKQGLNQMEKAMRQMVEASNIIAAKLAILNEKAGVITSVVTTISKVADQTNLLSLNASIEAEKAGEHGKTFSVIAREVRRLADQTANALLDIDRMVSDMVSAVTAGVMSVDKFSEEINSGVKQVASVGEQISKIIEQVQQQTVSFEEVNRGVQAQSLDADEINHSINQLSTSAQKASQSVRQFHLAIEQLNITAQDMQESIARIKP